jgi:Xaa-Pro aminopeptidase
MNAFKNKDMFSVGNIPASTLTYSRRKKFFDLMSTNSAALFLAAQSPHRNGDVEYRFRQDSSFWYLTGFNEPEAALLLLKTKQDLKSFIFVRPREKEKEIWTGRRAGPEIAQEITKVCEAFEIKELKDKFNWPRSILF